MLFMLHNVIASLNCVNFTKFQHLIFNNFV